MIHFLNTTEKLYAKPLSPNDMDLGAIQEFYYYKLLDVLLRIMAKIALGTIWCKTNGMPDGVEASLLSHQVSQANVSN